MKSWFGLVATPLITASVAVSGHAPAQPLDKKAVADAYVYLLGRAIPIRQEHTDLKEPGVDYNVIKYNPRGSADFVNPNLDVAYLEAWIAVDDDTPVLLEVPKVEGRYYVAQILDEWGEVITNIHGRDYPHNPYGKFALVAPGSQAKIPADAVRIELNSYKAKLLGRVELKDDPDGAMALQKQFRLTPLGTPKIRPAVPIPMFDNKSLMGVEIFDHADAIIDSAHDVSPVAAQMQARARHYARLAKDPVQRKALDEMIRKEVVPEFLDYAVTKSAVYENQWLGSLGMGNYGSNYWTRTSVNLVGLWGNTNAEVVYYVGTVDADGKPLNGANRYVLEFPADSRPETVVDAYWSIILVDVPDYRVVPNSLNRFNFNNYSGLKDQADGSLRILVSARPDEAIAPESNWLPAPDGKGFSLTLRLYVPKEAVRKGQWFPPALKRVP
ncbi:DUF1214 domain-containing protein [Pseudoxanthomonas suwonensis]|uniref:DUF1254 domain-containing protein n=1 Tax=Pseudoxanthomonas suwonensis TaxID=314722 RepID=A0A0E3Z1R2_9GAMM|nr:DUF1214 domain-containing protein [Pseudoxanthomonas suwonensis]AKC85792.1 hypothetical protein WQ53_02465 [Pseudoxanthomonas suwonensis]